MPPANASVKNDKLASRCFCSMEWGGLVSGFGADVHIQILLIFIFHFLGFFPWYCKPAKIAGVDSVFETWARSSSFFVPHSLK